MRTFRVGDQPSLPAVFQATAARCADRVALRTIDDAERLTWGEYAEEVARVARGLAALGIQRGDTVAMLLSNRPAFHVIDTAALHLGATGLSIYPTSPVEDIAYAMRDTGATVIFTEIEKLHLAREAGVAHTIVLVDGEADGTLPLSQLDGDLDFDAAWRAVGPDDLATIIFTSGTTGPPKGVELTHRSMLGNVQGWDDALGTIDGARVVSYLPMAHVAERQLSHYRAMAFGIEVTCCPEARAMPEYVLAVRPHYMFMPPRMLAKFHAASEGLEGRRLLEHFGLDDALVVTTGGAPVPPDLVQFWVDAGLPLVEGWGISECGAFGAQSRPESNRVGTCGLPLPGVELRLAEDGEILIRSPWLMRGYRNRPEATAEAIDPEGWLHTGDIGQLDSEGHLKIVDRKKEIIINAAGKNMSPANIEAKIKDADPLVGEVCVVGNDRPFNVALIVPDPEAAASYCGDVDRAVADALERANERLARVEQIKKFHIVRERWLPGSDEVTSTMKLRRKVIEKKYADEINALYDRSSSQAPPQVAR